MARTNPLQFIQQVRAETAKMTWPTRRETMLTTVMVMIMAAIFAIFFFSVDCWSGSGSRRFSEWPLERTPPRAYAGASRRTAARADSVACPFFDCAPRRAQQESRAAGLPPERLG